jgi:hypothetical protein
MNPWLSLRLSEPKQSVAAGGIHWAREVAVQHEGTRVCNICGVEKSIKEFNRARESRGGRTHQCKPCYNERQRANKGIRLEHRCRYTTSPVDGTWSYEFTYKGTVYQEQGFSTQYAAAQAKFHAITKLQIKEGSPNYGQ